MVPNERAGRESSSGLVSEPLRRAAGLLLIHAGAGGAALSLLWDVIYRHRALDLGAVGPFKMAGVAAGLVIFLAGVWLRFGPARAATARGAPPPGRPAGKRRAPAAPREAAPPLPEPEGEALAPAGPQVLEPVPPPEALEVPEAIPIVDAQPVEEGGQDPGAGVT
ncbi:MAG: hypothetical protein ACUVV6_07285 [Thermoplasmatota archaeon]